MELPAAIEIVPSGPIRATFTAPPSKSVTNRALVCAALADGESAIRSPLIADDTLRMAEALRALGADIDMGDSAWVVRGTAGMLSAPSAPLECGLSGTTLRFLMAVAALSSEPVRLTGDPALLRRPVGPLVDALTSLGAHAEASPGGLPPVTVSGGLDGGDVTVDARLSSQFASALMLAAPYAKKDVALRPEGAHAAGFLELTASVMKAFGAKVADRDGSWRIEAGRHYEGRRCDVEYDASAAAHLLALAVATGGSVTIQNTLPTSQPDARVVRVFREMGARVTDQVGSVVEGPQQPRSIEASLEPMPDQLPTIAALCALAPGRSVLTGAAVTRSHETDRIAALSAELRKTGVSVDELEDGLVIDGGSAHGARIATYDDHRMAMAFAALGARVPGIVIEDPSCVAKTYPGFWEDLRAAGVSWKPA